MELELKWHKLELECHEHRFAFMFEDKDDTDVALPQPLKGYPNGDEE